VKNSNLACKQELHQLVVEERKRTPLGNDAPLKSIPTCFLLLYQQLENSSAKAEETLRKAYSVPGMERNLTDTNDEHVSLVQRVL